MSTYNVSVSSDAVVLPVAPPAVGESGGPDLTTWTPRLICPRASTSGRRCCLGHRWPPANSRSELWRSARAVDGGSRDHCVAQALASRRSPGARNGSSGAALADARLWAKAVVWRLAVFASCPRSEPVVSKRSGSRPTSASACWNAPCQLTRRGVRSCNPGRSGSLVGADSQAAEIPQLCSDATKTAVARAGQCDSLAGFEWVVAGCWI